MARQRMTGNFCSAKRMSWVVWTIHDLVLLALGLNGDHVVAGELSMPL